MLSIFSALLLTIASLAAPGAFTASQFAQSHFNFQRPSTVRIRVQTCNSKGKVKSIQLRVTDGTLNLSSMDIFYVNGQKERLTNGFVLQKGQSSPWLSPSNQGDPCLNQIYLNVGASSGREITSVQLIGNWEQ